MYDRFRLLAFHVVLSVLGLALLLSVAPVAGAQDGQGGPRRLLLPEMPTASAIDRPFHTARFLGWRYAAKAHQDTSQWVRPHATAPAEPSIQPGRSSHSLLSSSRLSALAANSGSGSAGLVPGFVMPAALPTGFLPTGIVEGDFNEDGRPDLAISNGGDNTVYVLLSNGDGTFQVPVVLDTLGQSPVSLVAIRSHAGGHLDLALVDGDTNQLELFAGNGKGSFAAPVVVATFAQVPSYLATGDFNGDKNADLAVGLTIDEGATAPAFTLLLGNGTGGFPSSAPGPMIVNGTGGPLPDAPLVAADLNNDGYSDLATGFGFVFTSDHGSGFTQTAELATSDGLLDFAFGDLNGDGCLDVAATGGYGFLTFAKGNCDGSFSDGAVVGTVGDTAVSIDLADVNGDGHLDVVTASAFLSYSYPGTEVGAPGGYFVSVLQGNGQGGVAPAALYRVSPDNYALAVLDLTGDGRPEIVALSQAESKGDLLLNDGSGGFPNPSGETIGYTTGAVNAPVPGSTPQVLDLNGDGKPDVLLMEYGIDAAPDLVTALLNDGTGKLGQPVRTATTVAATVPAPIFTAGVFRPGKAADVIYVNVADPSASVTYLPGAGNGSFGTAVSLGTVNSPGVITSGDFNGDGKLDVAVYGLAGSGSATTSAIYVFLGDGTGNFRQLPALTFANPSPLGPIQFIPGDFNHDGKLDLLIGFNGNGGLVSSGDDLCLAKGNGDGTFEAPVTLMPHFGPVAVGDLNNDGYLDLVQGRDPDPSAGQAITAAALGTGGVELPAAVTVYLGQPGGGFVKNATYALPEEQEISSLPVLLGDFNGDGTLDIAAPYRSYVGPLDESRLGILNGKGDGTFSLSGIPYQLPAYDRPVVGADFRSTGRTDLLDLVGALSAIDTLSAGSSTLLSIQFDASPLAVGTGTATISVAQPAASAQTVTLTASDPAVQLPSSVSIPAGSVAQTSRLLSAPASIARVCSLSPERSTAFKRPLTTLSQTLTFNPACLR